MSRRTSSQSNSSSRNKHSPHPFKDEDFDGDGDGDEHSRQQQQQQQQQQQRHYQTTTEAASTIHNHSNEQQLRLLLSELSFWETDSPATALALMSGDHETINSTRMPPQQKQPLNPFVEQQDQQQQQQQQQVAAVADSPTLKELEAANTWQKAVDPASGRTYYYDSITRQSQWEKPREIRAIEKRIKKEQRQQQVVFFREMERNLLASLERGEVVPGQREMELVGPPQEPLYRGDNKRVRTISAVNEHLLAQLSLQEAPSKSVSISSSQQLSSSPVQGRPPLPARPPQQPPKPTAAASSNNSNGTTTTTTTTSSSKTSNTGNGSMPSYHSMDSLELSPDATETKKVQMSTTDTDALRGIDLLDHADLSSSPEPEQSLHRPPALHVRSHTAGGAVHDSMEQPDIDATINCVCSVYRAHIETAMSSASASPSAVQPAPHTARINFDVFRDDYEYRRQQQLRGRGVSSRSNSKKAATIPSVATIQAFYKEFYQRSQMEHDTIIMSLIYVERLMKMTNGALQPTPDNWSSVLISCMILASKVWDDLSMWNIDFSNLSVSSGLLKPFSLSRINELELAVLTCLNFAVAIPASEYAKYYYLLRNMMIRGGLLKLNCQQQLLSKDKANRLEDRTKFYQDSTLSQPDRRRQARSVDWSLLSSNGSDGSGRSNGDNNEPVLKEEVCLEQLVPMVGR